MTTSPLDLRFGEVIKDPYDIAPLSFNWAPHVPAASTISASEWSTDGGMTLSNTDTAALVTSCRLNGGTLDTGEIVTNKITLASGLRYSGSIAVILRTR